MFSSNRCRVETNDLSVGLDLCERIDSFPRRATGTKGKETDDLRRNERVVGKAL